MRFDLCPQSAYAGSNWHNNTLSRRFGKYSSINISTYIIYHNMRGRKSSNDRNNLVFFLFLLKFWFSFMNSRNVIFQAPHTGKSLMAQVTSLCGTLFMNQFYMSIQTSNCCKSFFTKGTRMLFFSMNPLDMSS